MRFKDAHPTAAPSDLVKLDSFDFILRTSFPLQAEPSQAEPAEPDVLSYFQTQTAIPIDGKPSCAFHIQCTLHPKVGSRFCMLHHRIVARAHFTYIQQPKVSNPRYFRSSLPSFQWRSHQSDSHTSSGSQLLSYSSTSFHRDFRSFIRPNLFVICQAVQVSLQILSSLIQH